MGSRKKWYPTTCEFDSNRIHRWLFPKMGVQSLSEEIADWKMQRVERFVWGFKSHDCPALVEIIWSSKLAIGFCCKLMSLPNSLREIMLERLDIYGCPALEKQLCDWSTKFRVCEIRADGRFITKGKSITLLSLTTCYMFCVGLNYQVCRVFLVFRIFFFLFNQVYKI